MKAVIPLCPWSLSTVAKTRNWSAVSARLIHILLPFRMYRSPSRRAVVARLAASLPTPGSVSPNEASFSPRACGTRYCCFCSSLPHWSRVSELSPVWTLRMTRNAVSARSISSHSWANAM